MSETINAGATRRSVVVSLVVNCAETLALGAAALVTGSVALRAQTTANFADVAVEVFLLIGVLSSARSGMDGSASSGLYSRHLVFSSEAAVSRSRMQSRADCIHRLLIITRLLTWCWH